jgi:hypothetical protein
MPRKKQETPPPLQSFYIEGILFEVRDETCWEIGSGKHRNLATKQRADKAIAVVFHDYFTKDGKRKLKPDGKRDYMRRGAWFAEEMQLHGLGGENGADDSPLRKKTYPEVKRWLAAVDAAMKQSDEF